MSENPSLSPSGFLTQFTGQARADAVIVGGGLTGVTAALLLSMAGRRTVLLEKRSLGCGSSWACMGLLRTPGDALLARIRRTSGAEAASCYDRLCQAAAVGLADLVVSLSIPCGLTHSPDGCLALSPMDLLLGMADRAVRMGCLICENSVVREVATHRVRTDAGEVDADFVILATGMPLLCRSLPVLSLLEPHMFEMRELAGPAPEINPADLPDCLDVRPMEGSLLLRCDLGRVGQAHLSRRLALSRDLRAHFSGLRTFDGCFRPEVLSLDGLPLIGPVRQASSLLMATGYSGCGLAGAYLAAQVLSRHIAGRPGANDDLFAPDRRYPGVRRVRLRGGLRITGDWLARLSSLGAPRCPHMGCRLCWSHETHRWECPCHGSSFGPAGELIDAPAARRAGVRSPRPPE